MYRKTKQPTKRSVRIINSSDKQTHPRSQTRNLSPAFHAKVCADHTTNTCSQHFAFVVQKDGCVVVEADPATVWPADGFACPDNNGASDVSAANLDGSKGCLCSGGDGASVLDNANYFIANGAPAVTDFVFEDIDTFNDERAGVVYDLGGASASCSYRT